MYRNVRYDESRRGTGRAESAVLAVAILLAAVSFAALGGPVRAGALTVSTHSALLSSPLGCTACHHGGVEAATDDACLSCHTGGGFAPQVYGGDAVNYRSHTGRGHDASQVTCIGCHSVHGPWLDNADGISGKLLKALDYQPEAIALYDPATSPHDEALSVWCTGCHKEAWPLGKGGASAGRGDSHPLKKADGRVAFGGATSCRSCHAAGSPSGIGSGEFPHYTPDADAMLVGAESVGAAPVGVTDRSLDAVCLRCHRSGTGRDPIGIGLTY